jgi:hypothetical protein
MMPSALELLGWLDGDAKPDDILCYGPETHLWLWVTGRSAVFLPTTPSVAVLRGYLAKYGVRYVIVDAPTLKRRPFLRTYFDSDPQGGMAFNEGLLSQNLPELSLAYRTQGRPSEFLVFRVTPLTSGR